MPYRLSALAEQDLEDIWLYVAEEASPTTADRLIDAIVWCGRRRCEPRARPVLGRGQGRQPLGGTAGRLPGPGLQDSSRPECADQRHRHVTIPEVGVARGY